MMSTHQTQFLSELASADPISTGTLAYLEARAKDRFYDYILRKFLERESGDGFTRADLARRIGRRPEVITRWLGAPGNWTIETVCTLLAGICAEELEPHSTSLLNRPPRNFKGDWLGDKQTPSNPSRSSVELKFPTGGEALERPKALPTGNTWRWEAKQ